MMDKDRKRPKLAVWKFTSCDGCQLQLLGLENELLEITGAVEIAYFPEATRAEIPGPYDISLVEGSIATPHDAERIHEVRRQSRLLIPIGACATGGGIQSLRNFGDYDKMVRAVYPEPEHIEALPTSTAIKQNVKIDFEIRGCPINKLQLLDTIAALLHGRPPDLPTQSVCMRCKIRGNVCVMVAEGIPCKGPVTQDGCGALCPYYDRGCYGCHGPMQTPNTAAMSRWWSERGMTGSELVRHFRLFNANEEPFRRESESHEQQ